ncbi:MAG: chorismate synthase [Erysipelotrichaceae bacterium]|nr:chorismate synthase [Erysipelotrichaceae bacterium]
MKNILGNYLTVTLFGESHGPCVGATLDGIAPGIKIDMEYLKREMNHRRATGELATARKEADEVQFVSGVKDGYTEGTPLTVLIMNQNVRSSDYNSVAHLARPSHADYTAEMKYLGYQDVRGGGHFSGRLTAPLVALGAIVKQALEEKGIYIGTHVASVADIHDDTLPQENLKEVIELLNSKDFALLNDAKKEDISKAILNAKAEGDSLGGVLETVVCGLPAGIGEPYFDSLESTLSHGLFSIGGVKGVEFGDGFDLTKMKGSEANDPLRMENGKVVTESNHAGGINGGISNGMPIVFRTAIKPISSIGKAQKTVDYKTMEEAELQLEGRHDPCIVLRARAVVDAVTAFVIADALCARYGYLYLRSEK